MTYTSQWFAPTCTSDPIRSLRIKTGRDGHKANAVHLRRRPRGQIKGYFLWFVPWFNSLWFWKCLAFSLTCLHLVLRAIRALKGWRWVALWGLDVCPLVGRLGAVFMRHHKYACCFMLYGGIYDRGATVFALSEVIYLSSAVTEGLNTTRDDCTSCQPAAAHYKCPQTLVKHVVKMNKIEMNKIKLFNCLLKLTVFDTVLAHPRGSYPNLLLIRHGQIESGLTGIKKERKTKRGTLPCFL